jgi:hypothetical protein
MKIENIFPTGYLITFFYESSQISALLNSVVMEMRCNARRNDEKYFSHFYGNKIYFQFQRTLSSIESQTLLSFETNSMIASFFLLPFVYELYTYDRLPTHTIGKG